MTVTTPRRTACPRCSTSITGDFKFCPTCAFRLKPGGPPPVEVRARRPGWGALFVGVVLSAVVVGMAVVGAVLWAERPRWVEEPNGVHQQRLAEPLTVRGHLLGSMVWLGPAIAMYHSSSEGELLPVYSGPEYFMRYEVTRGQYAEFLSGLESEEPAIELITDALLADARLRDAQGEAARIAYAREHLDRWWAKVADHLRASEGRDVERPPDLDVPLPRRYRALAHAPPSWVASNAFDELFWEMPRDVEFPPENLPATEVSWYDAIAFSQWASAVVGASLFVPTAVQWIRAGHGDRSEGEDEPFPCQYPWGNTPQVYACNNLNMWGKTSGRLLPVSHPYSDPGTTREGLMAMSGNAREWAQNFQLVKASESRFFVWRAEADDEEQQLTAPTMGGSFLRGIGDCTVTYRSAQEEDKRHREKDLGFRLMMKATGGPLR